MFIIYMIFAVLDVYEGGFAETIGFAIFQPIFGFVLVALTVALCVVFGLPIRLHKRANRWWRARQFIPIIGIVVGLGFIVASFHPMLMKQTELANGSISVTKEIPNAELAIFGWLLTSFSLLHWFPRWLVSLIQKIFLKPLNHNNTTA